MSDAPENKPDPVEKSLGDQATGADVSRAEEERSLGDQSTTGDALSSLSDLTSDLGEETDSGLRLIDLEANFQIEGELGQGGMGAVLLATDRQLKRKVAIKRILGPMAQSKTALQRFVTEAQSIAKLNHFNIVQVHEFGRDTEGPFLVLEYVEGGSLLDKLKKGKLEIEEAVDITCQLCDGLAVAHEQGIVHRDIKPANILLTKRGEPKLTDFGLARQETTDHGQTQAGAVLGTIDFMPPEQRRDATAADARSDLWSLAATAYQMITGSSPKVIRLDQLPGNLAPVIGKMLEDNPDKRYATAEEFKAELRKGLATVATTVAADLAAGVCPSCNAANDVSRKFCRGCRASLIEPCLSCETDNPVWEDVCGECGSSQQEEREQIRGQLSGTIESSLTLAREHEYEKALAQLSSVHEDQHAFTEDIRQQAAKQIELVTSQRDEQYQLRDQLVELTNQHQQAHDYGAVIRELEKIPAPLRSSATLTRLSDAKRDEQSSAILQQEISDDIKNKRIEGLSEKTTRFLKLKPRHPQIQKLHEQLLQRQQKVASQVTELLRQTEQQYEQHHDDSVLTTLANWPEALKQPARVRKLRELATRRLSRIQILKADIAAATTAAAKLSLVEQYLELRPNDKRADQLAEDLSQKVHAEHRQELEEEKRNRLLRWIAAACLVAVVLCFLFAGLWLRSVLQERAQVAAAEQAAAEQEAAEKAAILAGARITNTLGMTFNKLPAGTFMMGSPESEEVREDDEHQHQVTISKAFYMQTTEVTQGQWKAVMGTEPWKDEDYIKEGANYPAMYVSWNDAVAYCKKLSGKEGKTYRLPTEAQWEYACRAGTKTTWSFGNNENALGDYSWYEKNAFSAGEQYAHQVGLKKPNAFGLYDMHGNVWEWCYDYYDRNYYKESPTTDPPGPASGSQRVLRGGSWLFYTRDSRSAYRSRDGADLRYYNFGFRLVRELD